MMDWPERIGLSISSEVGSWRWDGPAVAAARVFSEDAGAAASKPAVGRPPLSNGGSDGPS